MTVATGVGAIPRWLAVSSIAVALSQSLTACDKIAGLDYSVAEDAGTLPTHTSSCGAFEFAPGAARCSACVDTQCCNAAESCTNESVCVAHMDCLARCGATDECVSRCALEHPFMKGSYVAAALRSCMTSNCSDACSWSCSTQPFAAACAACVGSRCCEHQLRLPLGYNTCAWNHLEGLDPEDPEHCANAHPDEKAAFDAARDCFGTSCLSECGADYGCVGSVVWPRNLALGIKVHVQIVDARNPAEPLPGVAITACTADPSCGTPLDSKLTGADGRATLDLPTFPDLEYFELEKDGVAALWYWLPPPHGTSFISLPMGDAAQRAESLAVFGGDPEAGTIMVVASSCQRVVTGGLPNIAAGLMVGTERGDRVGYFNGLTPDVSASATGFYGLALVHSVKLDSPIVTVFTEHEGLRVGSWPVYVRPGTPTWIALPPTPSRP